MKHSDIRRLREHLEGFTVDAVLELLGSEAWAALARNETAPGIRRLRGDRSALAVFVQLFQLQQSVELDLARQVFGDSFIALIEARYLVSSGNAVRASVDIRPYGDEDHDWWVVCDPTPGLDGVMRPMRSDFVLGISEASSSLARLTVREPVGRAMDLGTGCGVQSLHLSTHADTVVATDVNPRALELARFTADLNGIELDLRNGSLYEPVADEQFDLICTNPPFVVSPPQHERLTYRETNFDGDGVVRKVLTGAARHLAVGGRCQVLASWQIMSDQPWDERLAGWVDEANTGDVGLDAWIVQRECADLPLYVEMWLADAGLRGSAEYTQRYDEWLSWFEQRGVEAMGFGWINLHRSDRAQPQVHCEEYLGAVAGPIGPDVLVHEAATEALDTREVLAHAWQLSPSVRQFTSGPVGASDPAVIEIHQQQGLQRSRQLDTVEAGFLSACDGELTAGALLDALGELLELPELRTSYATSIHDLIRDGFLVSPRR